MATLLPEPVPDAKEYFNALSSQIRKVLNQLIAQLIAKKEALLRKVSKIEGEYWRKEAARKEECQKIFSQSDVQQEISLDTPIKLPHITFQYHTFKRLQGMIKKFGEVSVSVMPVISEKIQPLLAIGLEGNSVKEFKHPRSIAIDETNEQLFITDCGNARIQILSFKGDFVSQFGQGVLKWPWGIGVIRDQIFVTDILLHVVLCFDRNTLELISRVGGHGEGPGKLIFPLGLSVDLSGDIYIADSLNNRVSVFTELLDFVTCIGVGQLKEPQDVKLTTKFVVVLDSSEKCVRFFSNNGEFLSCCVSQGENCQVWKPFFFGLDPEHNLIISDYNHHTIKVFTSLGEHFYTIGTKGQEKGQLKYPYGVALSSSSGVIFIVSENSSYTLQAF